MDLQYDGSDFLSAATVLVEQGETACQEEDAHEGECL